MSNHVMNILNFGGSEESIGKILDYVKSSETIFDFNKILPIRIITSEKLEDWQCNNYRTDEQRRMWGTRSNAFDIEIAGNEVEFCTAWTPPTPVIASLAKLFLDVTITHKWAEESCGINCGEIIYQGDYYEECFVNDYSNTAYSIYVECWGDTGCLYLDEMCGYVRKECETCGGC